LNKKFRLASSIDFKRVRSQGTSFAHPLVVLVKLEEPRSQSQIGLSVSKYVGNAVIRNKIKRQLREIVRPMLPEICPNHIILLIARAPIAQANYQEIETAVLGLFTKGKLLIH